MGIQRRFLAAGAAFALALLAVPARGAEPSAADKETSRNLYAEGMKALDSADFAHAERACRGAYELVNAPTGALCWGHALQGLGKLVEARDAYLSAAHYPSKDGEPPVFTSAREEGRAGAERLEKRIAALVLNVSGVSESAPLRVAVDGTEIASDTARLPRKVNPGYHVILVASPGFRTARVEVTAPDGQEKRVDVQLRPLAPGESSQDTTTTLPPSSGPSPITYAALGVGAAGLVAGSIFGVMALSGDKNTLNQECATQTTCPGSAQKDIDALHSHEILADIGLGVGLVGIGIGAVLLITGTADRAPAREDAMRVRPFVGLNALGVHGAFQ